MSEERAGGNIQQIFLGGGMSISPPEGWLQTGKISEESLEKKLKNKVTWTPPGECRAKIHWQVAKIAVAPDVVEFLRIVVDQELGELPIEALQPLQPALIRLAADTITSASVTKFENSNPFLYLEYHDQRSNYRGLVCYAPAKSGNEGEVQILAYEGVDPFFSRFEEPAKQSLRSLSDELFGTSQATSEADDTASDTTDSDDEAFDPMAEDAEDDFPLDFDKGFSKSENRPTKRTQESSKSADDMRSGWVRAQLDEDETLVLRRTTRDSLARPSDSSDGTSHEGEVEYAPEGSVDLPDATRSIIPPEWWQQSTFRGAQASLLVPSKIISWSPPDTENVIFHWHQRRIDRTVEAVAVVQQLMSDQMLGVARQEAVHSFTRYLLNRDDVALNAITIEQFEESGPLLSLQVDSSDTQGLFFLWFDDSNTEVINIIAYEAEQDLFVEFYDSALASIETLTTKPAPPAKAAPAAPPERQEAAQPPAQVGNQRPATSQNLKRPPTAQDLKKPETSQDLKKPGTSQDLQPPAVPDQTPAYGRKPTRTNEFPSQTVKRPTVPDGFLALTEEANDESETEDFVGQLISPDELAAAFPLDFESGEPSEPTAEPPPTPHKATMELSSTVSKIKAGKLHLTAEEREAIARALDENSDSVVYELRPGQTITSIVEDTRPDLNRSAIIARVKHIYEFNRFHDNPIKAWTLTAGVTVILPTEMFRK